MILYFCKKKEYAFLTENVMPIDFNSLIASAVVIVPVLANSFQYHHKKYRINVPDGWWKVSLNGNNAVPLEPYMWSGAEKKFVKGYSYGNQIIFQNFDTARRQWGMGLTAPLHFNMIDTFSPINVIAWENGQFFYACINYADMKIYDVKLAYDNEQSLNEIKGVTPELRTLYLFHTFERDQLREMLRQQHEKEEHEKKMQEIPYRLKMTLERAGARLLSYSQSGNRLIIDWELLDGSYKYNSVIDANTWMVQEAGYCLSGGDKKLNVTALAKTAEEYEDRGVTFITRH